MSAARESGQGRAHRGRSSRSSTSLVVLGCAIFGAGVMVGALLWPLARSKAPRIHTENRPSSRSQSSRSVKSGSEQGATPGESKKKEPLTFFETLKEKPSPEGKSFVPFKPTGEPPPPVEALAPKGALAETSAVAPERPTEASEPPPDQGATHYYIHVADFQYRDNAVRLKSDLAGKGFSAFATTVKSRYKPHRVRVGPYDTRKEAARVARLIQADFLYPTTVIEEPSP